MDSDTPALLRLIAAVLRPLPPLLRNAVITSVVLSGVWVFYIVVYAHNYPLLSPEVSVAVLRSLKGCQDVEYMRATNAYTVVKLAPSAEMPEHGRRALRLGLDYREAGGTLGTYVNGASISRVCATSDPDVFRFENRDGEFSTITLVSDAPHP